MQLTLEFGGGLELLCESVKIHTVDVNLKAEEEKLTMRDLLTWVRTNLIKERPEMFMKGDTVRPGVLVLVNDCDWELSGQLDTTLEEKDVVVFISTLHDSSDDVCIEDCYISTGDDLIAIKSGWDEYGISYGQPSTNITIRRLTGETGSGSGLAIGSEMSGGVSGVYAEDLQFFNSANGIRIKTAPGRGGYVRNIYISNVSMTNVKTAIKFTGQYGEHPDESYDPKELPAIYKITIKDVVGTNISQAGILEGIEGDTFRDICLSNVTLSVTKTPPWNCSYVRGYSDLVLPKICEALDNRIYPQNSSECYFLSSPLQSVVYQNRPVFTPR